MHRLSFACVSFLPDAGILRREFEGRCSGRLYPDGHARDRRADAGGTGQQVTVNATATNGFTGMVTVAIKGLPNGVFREPAS